MPKDIANMAVFLASDYFVYVTCQTYVFDGTYLLS